MAPIYYVIFIYFFIGVATGLESVVDEVICETWTTWTITPESACGVTCGTGTTRQNRTRTCVPGPNSPLPRPPRVCTYSEVEVTTRACDTGIPCTGSVGTWGAWANEGLCSTYCGDGGTQTQRRTRTCTPAGLCSEPLVDRREVGCLRTAFQLRSCFRYAAQPCEGRGFQTFLYDYILPFFNLCVNGRYEQVQCPATRFGLVSTCRRDVLRCNLYSLVEFFCLFRG